MTARFVDVGLTAIAQSAFLICTSVSDALAQVFIDGGKGKGVTLSLQSRYGVMFKLPDLAQNTTMTLCTHPLLETLHASGEEERIALLLGAKEWNMVACFSIAGIAFYPVITIPAPPVELRWVRYELLAALDCFSLNCKQALSSFVNGPGNNVTFENGPNTRQGAAEKLLLENLLGYSQKVDCAALIDNDGFVILAVGHTEKAESIAGKLALFNRQAVRDLDRLGAVNINSLSIGGGGSALLVGRTPGKNVSLAISVLGDGAPVIARFLFDAGTAALRRLSGATNTLADYSDAIPETPLRERDSWLLTPRVVPKGAFVSLAGGNDFHDPQCARLADGIDADFRWLDTRASAIKAGLVPCTLCNP